MNWKLSLIIICSELKKHIEMMRKIRIWRKEWRRILSIKRERFPQKQKVQAVRNLMSFLPEALNLKIVCQMETQAMQFRMDFRKNRKMQMLKAQGMQRPISRQMKHHK